MKESHKGSFTETSSGGNFHFVHKDQEHRESVRRFSGQDFDREFKRKN